ncbi:MAG: hypothetical protein PHR48_03400 [Candidatus ainarchaeum sp.]|nr:hypothetical protein [Candidatus ainarchaeum sp.]MDD4662885.1 hypothetical protein [Candidatus ainarchaeum sp.]
MFLRGGSWNNSSNSGLLALNLNNDSGNLNNNIGLRCAVVYSLKRFFEEFICLFLIF